MRNKLVNARSGPKRRRLDDVSVHKKMVVVAVKASQDIPKTALVWALTHVVRPGDQIALVVVSPSSSGKKFMGFPRLSGNCAGVRSKSNITGAGSSLKYNVHDSCSKMIIQLPEMCNLSKTKIKPKVVSGSPLGAVAAESKRVHASWVVIDKHLKNEEKVCMEELQCNIVVMKNSQPKVLRLNLAEMSESESQDNPLPSFLDRLSERTSNLSSDHSNIIERLSAIHFNRPLLGNSEKEAVGKSNENNTDDSSNSKFDSENPSLRTVLELQKWATQIHGTNLKCILEGDIVSEKHKDTAQSSINKTLMHKFSELDLTHGGKNVTCQPIQQFNRSSKESTITILQNEPPATPDLCSICINKAPMFGKPPKRFSFLELDIATDGFSEDNLLSKFGLDSFYRGILSDGQVVAIKQHELGRLQGELKFYSQVEVLSCVQHRNVVVLIGYCLEDKIRLLVYEFICNGSLGSHLYDPARRPLEWHARRKIALGAARGLRYLHEDCRVGCIVHGDFRPDNILLTHDFEPLVGGFGLAMWQPDGNLGEKTQVIETFGYVAPECAQIAQFTEKSDIYSFGIVLLELVTGRRALDINQTKGQQCLTDWARPFLKESAIEELVDPQLGNSYSEHELICMLNAASLCINRDPGCRPRISQVLRILEEDIYREHVCASTQIR
ncbi:hypothetical protein HPP92_023975 [Vanilla planifolia]|uniref:Protein kinase domain-containing protein n=1 Tax=Vanilla planifolia TaxID=51239 RepID=A0A835PNU6_VANPL|nr:hypothetical protein HPP92_023975 [Vanilla planifolia]